MEAPNRRLAGGGYEGQSIAHDMNDRLTAPARLTIAAVCLSLVSAFSVLSRITGYSSGEAAFRLACLVFAVVLVFMGVHRSAMLQLLWGWGLVVVVPALLALCIVSFRGLELIGGLISLVAASVGGYLLVVDASVKTYRNKIRSEHVAIRENAYRS